MIKSLLRYFFIFFMLLTTACSEDVKTDSYSFNKTYGENETLNISLSATNINTAQTIKLKLSLRAPEDTALIPPVITQELGGFSVISHTETTPALSDGYVTTEMSYELAPFLAGDYTIPELKAEFRNSEKTIEVKSEPQTIKVTSLLTDQDKELKDIFGQHSYHTRKFYIWISSVSLFVLLLAYFIYRKLHQPPVVIPPTPAELALAALDALKQEELTAKGDFKHFYTKLSLILRSFIEAEFGLSAPERTTEEFLPEIQNNPIFRSSQKELLGEFLQQSDLVKFAKYIPQKEIADKAFALCHEFVVTGKSQTGEVK